MGNEPDHAGDAPWRCFMCSSEGPIPDEATILTFAIPGEPFLVRVSVGPCCYENIPGDDDLSYYQESAIESKIHFLLHSGTESLADLTFVFPQVQNHQAGGGWGVNSVAASIDPPSSNTK